MTAIRVSDPEAHSVPGPVVHCGHQQPGIGKHLNLPDARGPTDRDGGIGLPGEVESVGPLALGDSMCR